MSLKRRDFVKLCTGTVAGFGISQMFHPAIQEAFAQAATTHPVIWIQGQGCTGCSVSLLNSTNPIIADVLLKIISLRFHPTVMMAEGETALDAMYRAAEQFKGKFVLAVEGSIPMAAAGKYCIVGEKAHKEITMTDMVTDLGKKALAVLAVGTCSSYGGIPAAKGSQTEAKSVKAVFDKAGIKTPVVNIPGCPPHPDWIVGTIALALKEGIPAVAKLLDNDGRPKPFFGENIHENCPYLKDFDAQKFSKTFTQKAGCRAQLGCAGPNTSADCYKRKWNGGVNWCIDNAVCIGCVEKDFPDGASPFYVAKV